jgi:tetratricopeptide (TPR) repeat protein
MSRNLWIGVALAFAAAVAAPAQDQRRGRIDVEHYTIDAEINPSTQSISAKTAVRFVPQDNNISSLAFELNNGLNVSRVEDQEGKQVPASRSRQDFTVRASFDPPLEQGKPVTLTFHYDGQLTGNPDDSPVWGIRFAAIHPEFAYLMYPARWFPISGYSTDRYSAAMNISVPQGFKVLGSGIETAGAAGERTVHSFKFDRQSFPGSIAVVKGQGTPVLSEGLTTTLHFRGAEQEMAGPYGTEVGRIVNHFGKLFGLPPYANLTVVQTENGAPNGFSAPGLIFLSPRAIGTQVSSRLLANQIARQWWHTQVSPATRNHLWLTNGLASYAELLWTEQANGAAAAEQQYRDVTVEALTIDNVPVIQAARLEDYSPELWALTGAKGAAVIHMLRFVIGDDHFFETLRQYGQQFNSKSAGTEDFRKVAERVSGQDLGYFFIQWIESSGAPEFKLEYTVFRTKEGFRVMGKIAQDLDTFRMPVDLNIETEGNPEVKRVEVVGTSSEFSVNTFGKPLRVVIDPNSRVLRYSNQMRVAVAIRRGEQFAELSEFAEALKEYQRALETSRNSSLAHYRIAEVFFLQNNYQSAANEFREALNGDLEPKWTEVWSHINLGKIFDITGQRDRAVNEYTLAQRTKDNTQGALEEAAKYLKAPYERQRRTDY